MSTKDVVKQVSLPSKTGALEPQRKWLLTTLKNYQYCDDDIFAVHLALEEAFFNAVTHGNKLAEGKKVDIRFVIDTDKIEITITDSGNGFKPETLPDCRKEENLYKTNGRGIFLIRAYMDTVEFNKRGNSIHMVKTKKTNSRDI